MAKWLGCLTRNPQCGGLKPTEDISYKNLKKKCILHDSYMSMWDEGVIGGI